MTSIRLLKADEIECRVGTINEKGLALLLFKDARVDQKILDETFTPFGWMRRHQAIDGNLYCTVAVWDEGKGQWIEKQDVGTMSYSEKEKGQASDSFKRACFNWGIGRELYTAPFIWIPASRVDIKMKDNKYYTNERFSVQAIDYNAEREICSLSVTDSRHTVVFHMDPAGKQPAGQGNDQKLNGTIGSSQMTALEKELERTGVALETVLQRYNLQCVDQMTPEIYQNAISGLKKSKSRRVA